MKKATYELVAGLVRAAVADKGEQAEALRLLAPREETRKDRQLTTREAAELAGVSGKTLFRWEKRGLIHAKRFTGSRIRWSRNEIETFLCLEGTK